MARDRAGNLDGDGGGLPATALAVAEEPETEEGEGAGRGCVVRLGRLLAGGMTKEGGGGDRPSGGQERGGFERLWASSSLRLILVSVHHPVCDRVPRRSFHPGQSSLNLVEPVFLAQKRLKYLTHPNPAVRFADSSLDLAL